MGRKKVIWAQSAKIQLFEALEFYRQRNQSDTYSKKLFKKISKNISFLKKYPEMGIKTDMENVRGLLIENFILFYEISQDQIIIYSLGGTSQNPDLIKVK